MAELITQQYLDGKSWLAINAALHEVFTPDRVSDLRGVILALIKEKASEGAGS